MLTSQNIQIHEEKSVEELLNIVPVISPKKEIITLHPKESEDGLTGSLQQEVDFQEARKNLKDLIGKSDIAIDSLLGVATDTGSARAYEVLANLIRTSLDINAKLVEIHNNKSKNIKKIEQINTPVNTTNNMFVGNTSALLDLIKKQMDK